MNFLKHILTGVDNETFDVARVALVVGIISFLGFAGYEVYKSGHFDMVNFSVAYTGLIAGGAAGVKIKESCEPEAK